MNFNGDVNEQEDASRCLGKSYLFLLTGLKIIEYCGIVLYREARMNPGKAERLFMLVSNAHGMVRENSWE